LSASEKHRRKVGGDLLHRFGHVRSLDVWSRPVKDMVKTNRAPQRAQPWRLGGNGLG
jgi:hypothetical protein